MTYLNKVAPFSQPDASARENTGIEKDAWSLAYASGWDFRCGRRYFAISKLTRPVTSLVWFLLCSCLLMASDRLEVDLKNAARDPLIDFTSPIAGSPDRVEVTRDGLLIRQGRDKLGVAKRDTGFKFLLSASGDFKASLDLKKVRLDEPTSGWGQGLVFSVWLDDPEQSVLQICLLALPGSGLTIRAERIGRKVTPPRPKGSECGVR